MRGKLVLCALLLVVTSYAGASLGSQGYENSRGSAGSGLDPKQSSVLAQSQSSEDMMTYLESGNQSSTSTSEVESELVDTLSEQIADMQRAIDLLRLQLQLGDELIDSQAAQIQGLENSLESVKRLSDARVEAEKARCPRCLKPWLNWTTRGLAFAVGGYAGRGSCDFP